MRALRQLLFISLLFATTSPGATIGIAQLGGYVHANGSLHAQLDGSAGSFFTTLDADNLGTFGWTFTNTSGTALSNLYFLVFLDADIDRDLNTFFNEYGEFGSLALPPSAILGSIAASSWEIDEPGFLFGNIVTNLFAGVLENSNGVPSSAPDDASLALGFFLAQLSPGQSLTVRMSISRTDIGGLRQVDPDSDFQFYFNGAAEVTNGGPSPIPEPSTFALMISGVVAALVVSRSGSGRKGSTR